MLNEFALGSSKSIKEVSVNDLVATLIKIKKNNIPGWMTEMQTGEGIPTQYGFKDVWAELIIRKEQEKISQVKTAFEKLSEKKMINVTPDNVVSLGNTSGQNMVLQNVHGFHLPKKMAESPVTPTETGREVVMDMIQFHVKAQDEEKKTIQYISEAEAKAVRMPFIPFFDMFQSSELKRSAMVKEYAPKIRKALGQDLNGTVRAVLSDKDKKMRIPYEGGVFPIVAEKPKTAHWQAFYNYLKNCRAYRGADGKKQSSFSSHYYFGHMPIAYYRTAVTVGNICRLGIKYGIKCLELREIKGDMTLSVVNSLASQGWSIRILYDATKKKSDNVDQPGVWRYVPFQGFYLRYHTLTDHSPNVVSHIFKVSTAIDQWTEDSKSIPKGAIMFATIYCHDALFERRDYTLVPSLSAHTGQVLIVSPPPEDKESQLDNFEYRSRCVTANTYKNTYVFKRSLYYPKDPYKLDFNLRFVTNQIVSDGGKEEEWEEFNIVDNVFKFDPIRLEEKQLSLAERIIKKPGLDSKSPPGSVLDQLDNENVSSRSCLEEIFIATKEENKHVLDTIDKSLPIPGPSREGGAKKDDDDPYDEADTEWDVT